MPPVRMHGDGRMAKDPKKTFGRLLKYLGQYKITLLLVLLCILAAALVQSRSATALGELVDEFYVGIIPGAFGWK